MTEKTKDWTYCASRGHGIGEQCADPADCAANGCALGRGQQSEIPEKSTPLDEPVKVVPQPRAVTWAEISTRMALRQTKINEALEFKRAQVAWALTRDQISDAQALHGWASDMRAHKS